MKAELLSVGTELLLGEILNTDAKFLAEELSMLGISVYYQTVVGDNKKRLTDALELALSRADIVIASGGLGPTPDDLTKEVIAEAMGETLVLHEESMRAIEAYYQRVNREMPESNKKQAMLPEHGIVLANPNGTAPGCIIEKNGKTVIMLPGPPRELEPMFIDSVRPYLLQKSGKLLLSKNLRLFGIGESKLAEMLQDLIAKNENPTVAPYAETAGVRLRITASCRDASEGEELIRPVLEHIKSLVGAYIYSEEDKPLSQTVAECLIAKNITIAAAESCTGGMFSKMIVDYPGTSAIFSESVVTYSNEAKQKYLGVREETLARFGAVSRETATEMAQGIRRAAGSDIGVGITGIAGPDGGTAEKPVGLVYVGICFGEKTDVLELHLTGNREKVRYTACQNAFFRIYQHLCDC
ncbi:MAG: competence/damage-inducible protein A [Ruminococcaceae bacterium]|nr:competence/damage-inducible protein A [Oscillospiraceae bacterium]